MDKKQKTYFAAGSIGLALLIYLFVPQANGINWFVNGLIAVLLPIGLFLSTLEVAGKNKKKKFNTEQWYLLGVLLLISVVYLPSVANPFSNWDDPNYVLANPLIRSFGHLKEIFAGPFLGMYQPLSLLSLQLDYFAGELNASHYHLTNNLLHVLNSFVLFLLLTRLFKKKGLAIVVTLLFGLHPVQVESVAWVTERKNLLFALFYLVSMFQYVKYAESNKTSTLLLSLLSFALSLLAKPQGVMLAPSLFLIDFLLKRNIPTGKHIVEKGAFFVLALLAGLSIFYFAEGEVHEQSIFQTILFGGFAFTKYIFQLLLPTGFSTIYPYPETVAWYHYLGFVFFIAIVATSFILYRKNRTVAFGIWFFILNIMPLLQFIPSSYFLMADRYNYIPSIGIFILLGYLYEYLHENHQQSRKTVLYAYSAFMILLIFVSVSREKMWGNDFELWDNVLEKYPNQAQALNNRGFAWYYLGQPEKAMADYNQAVKANPKLPTSYINRGTLLLNNGQLNQAMKDFNRALSMTPTNATALVNRGLIFNQMGKYEEALRDFTAAIKANPAMHEAYISRGALYAGMGELEKSIQDYTKTIELDPGNATAYSNRGLSYARSKNEQAAIADFNRCLAIDPTFTDAYSNRGFILYKHGKYSEAIADFSYALKLNPQFGNAYMNRGLAYIELKQVNLACSDFQQAAQLGIQAARTKIQEYCTTR